MANKRARRIPTDTSSWRDKYHEDPETGDFVPNEYPEVGFMRSMDEMARNEISKAGKNIQAGIDTVMARGGRALKKVGAAADSMSARTQRAASKYFPPPDVQDTAPPKNWKKKLLK